MYYVTYEYKYFIMYSLKCDEYDKWNNIFKVDSLRPFSKIKNKTPIEINT
jgi:hypothetical protein